MLSTEYWSSLYLLQVATIKPFIFRLHKQSLGQTIGSLFVIGSSSSSSLSSSSSSSVLCKIHINLIVVKTIFFKNTKKPCLPSSLSVSSSSSSSRSLSTSLTNCCFDLGVLAFGTSGTAVVDGVLTNSLTFDAVMINMHY